MKHDNAIYLSRAVEPAIRECMSQFPAVLVTGPRQAGKSTLLRHVLKSHRYVSLDDPSVRLLAERDPALFLSANQPPIVIDEIQYAPMLLSYIKMHIDEHRTERGLFALTGSQLFPLMQGVSESLAGRIALFTLYPFSADELQADSASVAGKPLDSDLPAMMTRGFYPELVANPIINAERWFESYVGTYLERDVRNIRKVGDLGRFREFLALLAARAGGLLNLSEIGKECGITQPTAKDWISVLETTCVVYILRPWHRNITKRVTKSPKLYFVDTGLLCHLLGIESGDRLLKSPDAGRIFENMVVMEALKRKSATTGRVNLFYYRTAAGVEVDLIVERGNRLSGCEIKFGKTPRPDWMSNFSHAARDIPFTRKIILSAQNQPLPLAPDIIAQNWRSGLTDIFI